jgi:DNA-binding IscR family transcriptional regulator
VVGRTQVRHPAKRRSEPKTTLFSEAISSENLLYFSRSRYLFAFWLLTFSVYLQKLQHDIFMNNDTRLAVAAHILALLSFAGEDSIKSELLARSVNTNAVVIRRLMSRLKKAGHIGVRSGIGGATLLPPPEKITLLDVYQAVVPKPSACPFYLHKSPNSKCFVGKNIHDALEIPFAKVNQAMQDSLATTTIADIAAFIQTRMSSGKQLYEDR